MTEWVLLVWLLVPSQHVADPILIGTYRDQAHCERAAATIEPAEGVTFIARCVERDK